MLAVAASFNGIAQITEIEEDVRSERVDSLDGWRKGFTLALNGSNVGFSNWAAGGVNAIALNSSFRGYAHYHKGKASWDNNLDLGYGIVKQGDADWIKADDRIELSSKFGRRASRRWYYSALLNFRTQFTAGYAYPNDSIEISGFMAPAYTLLAVGMDYKLKKEKVEFSMFIAPLTTKLTVVNSQILADQGAFGVTEAVYDDLNAVIEPGKRFRAEVGGYFRSQLTWNLADNINFNTSLDVFSNYLNNPQNIDINWQTGLEVELWKFITLTFGTHLIYDDDIDIPLYDAEGVQTGVGPRTQFKHVSTIGLMWKVKREPPKKKP